MSFDGDQRGYYLREINRALPVNGAGGIPSDDTIALALGNVDPMMPGVAGAPATTEARQFLSYYGGGSAAYAADAACRQITNPLQMRSDPASRTGCGWYFRADGSAASTAAHGTRRGPMSPTLDAAGAGQWIWDPMEAALMESQKQAALIQSCPQIQYSAFPNMGWCPSTNSALATDGMGNPLFPRAPGGDCPGGGIITNASQCAPPGGSSAGGGGGSGGGGSGDPCAPTANGTLSASCLVMLAQQSGLSTNGALVQAVNSGDWSTVNSLMPIVGANINWDTTNVQNWLTACQRLATIAGTTPGRAGGAAGALAYGTKFDPCALQPTDSGPFDPACITQLALSKGYSPSGGLLPANIGMGYWNQYTKTWADVGNLLDWWKQTADTTQADPGLQKEGILNAYGTNIQYPKTDCNNAGVMLYRYYFPPAWDWSLMPPQGPQTHFIGRYIFKKGLPSTSDESALPSSQSTMKDMAPSGGNLTEAHRLECNFQVQSPNWHVFQVQTDDQCSMYIDDDPNPYMTVGCCGVWGVGPAIKDWRVGETHKLTWVYVNGGGPWSFGCQLALVDPVQQAVSFGPVPAAQTYMTQDRRKPTLGLEFAKITAGTSPISDTNRVLTNWEFIENCQIGQAYGQNCMVFTNGGGLHNFSHYAQGIGSHALKSMTCRLYIDSVTLGNSGTWPSVWSFANFSASQPAGNPRLGAAPESWDFRYRTEDMSMVLNPNGLAAYGIMSNLLGTPWQTSQYVNIPMKQWFHLAVVWDDDWQGFAMYVNGSLADHKRLTKPVKSILMEQICIGSDAPDDGAAWSGGMAWWRGFDYRLSTDQITLDMNDNWDSIY